MSEDAPFAPVEVTTRYVTTVPDLPAAWAFVMDHVDKVGKAPSVHIEPVWIISDDPNCHDFHFAVVVAGMTEEKRDG